MQNYFREIENTSASKVFNKKVFQKMKEDAQQVQQKDQKTENLRKKGMGLASLLFLIGSGILISYAMHERKISEAITKIKQQTVVIANLFMEGTVKPLLRWMSQHNLISSIANVFAEAWNKVGDGLLFIFKKINDGFNFLLNADNDYYKTNIFHFIFTQLLSKVANNIVAENTIFKVLQFFGIKYQANIKYFPNLNAYIKYGPKTMKEIKQVSSIAQQSSANRNKDIHGSQTTVISVTDYKYNFTRTERSELGEAVTSGVRSNWATYGYMRDKQKDYDFRYVDFVESGKDWTSFINQVNEMWKYAMQETPKVYNISVRNISQTGKSFPNPFEGLYGGVWVGINERWNKLRDFELETIGGQTIRGGVLFPTYQLELVPHFDKLFEEVKKDSYLMPWWDQMEKQRQYLVTCYRNSNAGEYVTKLGRADLYNRAIDYSKATGWFGMGDYAKTIYLSSVLVIIKNRIQRERAMNEQTDKQVRLVKNYSSEKGYYYTVYKGMLYKQFDALKIMVDNVQTPIQRKNKSLTTGAIRPQQYFVWVEAMLKWETDEDGYGWAFMKTFRQLKKGKMYDFDFINQIFRKVIIKLGQYNQKKNFTYYGGNVAIGLKRSGGGYLYYTHLNGTYNVKSYDNLNDMKALTNEDLRKDGYISRNVLSGRLIQLYVQIVVVISDLYKERHQLLTSFQENLKLLKNRQSLRVKAIIQSDV